MIFWILLSTLSFAEDLFNAESLIRDFIRPAKQFLKVAEQQMPTRRTEHSIEFLKPDYVYSGNHFRNEYFLLNDGSGAKIFLSLNGVMGISVFVYSDDMEFLKRKFDLLTFNFELPQNYQHFSVEIPNIGTRVDCLKNANKEDCIFKFKPQGFQLFYHHTFDEFHDKKVLWFWCGDCSGEPLKVVEDKKTGDVRYYINDNHREVSPQEFIGYSNFYLPWYQGACQKAWDMILN